MKVSELIEALKELPPDSEVFVWETHGTNDSWLENVFAVTKRDGRYVIE